MAHHYLVDCIEPDASSITLSGAEAKHAVTVSRVRAGERLTVGDGAGTIADCVVATAAADALELTVTSIRTVARDTPRIVLAQALAKGDRDELAVQAATELGIDAVIPWAAQHSVSRWEGAKVAKGRARWASIVREATKQSIRPWLPTVDELHTTRALQDRPERLLVLDPDAEVALTSVPLDERDLLLVVGPEGGIAPAELDAFAAGGATLVRLGATVLRTSTAGPAALAVLNARLGRW